MVRMLVAGDGRHLLRPVILHRGLARQIGDADHPAEAGFGAELPCRDHVVRAVWDYVAGVDLSDLATAVKAVEGVPLDFATSRVLAWVPFNPEARMPTLTIEYETDADRLALEQAVAFFTQMKRVAAKSALPTLRRRPVCKSAQISLPSFSAV